MSSDPGALAGTGCISDSQLSTLNSQRFLSVMFVLLVSACRKQEAVKPAAALRAAADSRARVALRGESGGDGDSLHARQRRPRRQVDAGDDGRRRRRPRLRRRRQARPPLRVERLLAGRPAREGPEVVPRALQERGRRPRRPPRFRDVTREAGLQRVFYGMGAAVADFDNDGKDDVYVTALERNFLFHNLGGGRFEEIAGEGRRRRLGLGHVGRLVRLRRRRAARPLRVPLRGLDPEEGPLLHARREDEVLLHARALPGHVLAPLPQPRGTAASRT